MTRTSPTTSIDLPFADGIYTFRLGLAQIAELQAKCGIGIGGLYARLLRGRYVVDTVSLGLTTEAEFHLDDVIEPIRQGLIGGRRGEVDGAAIEVTSIVASRLVAVLVVPAGIGGTAASERSAAAGDCGAREGEEGSGSRPSGFRAAEL